MAIKAFWKDRGKLLFLLALAVAVIVYAAVELNGLPGVYQHVFLPGEQLAETEGGQPVNRYLRDLVDKKESADTALDGSCEPTTLYAVAQPATVETGEGENAASARLVGLDENYLSVEPFALYTGRYFYPDEYTYGEKVALLDEQLAVALFQYAEPLSEEIVLSGEKYRVIGIVRDHKRVGDQEEYSLYVPYRSLVSSTQVMSCVIFEGKPVKGAGGWAAFQSAAKQLSESGSTHSLPKESMNGKMPLRLLLVISGWVLALYLIRILNRLFSRVCDAWRSKIREEYAARLLGWLLLRAVGLVIGYAACVAALAGLFVVLIQPVFTFPGVGARRAGRAQGHCRRLLERVAGHGHCDGAPHAGSSAAARFYSRLMGWACGLRGAGAGLPVGRRSAGAESSAIASGKAGAAGREGFLIFPNPLWYAKGDFFGHKRRNEKNLCIFGKEAY